MSGECEFPKFHATPADIADILKNTRVIAVVGLSPKPHRPSHGVADYLKSVGYKIIPVNPGHKEILGEPCYPSLRDVPDAIDCVDIFRRPEAVLEIVDQAIEKKAKFIWMQEGIVNNQAAEKALAAGLKVVMNRCMLKDHAALGL